MTAGPIPARPWLAWPLMTLAWGGVIGLPAVARIPLLIAAIFCLDWGAVTATQGTHPGIERVPGDVFASVSTLCRWVPARDTNGRKGKSCPSVDGSRCSQF